MEYRLISVYFEGIFSAFEEEEDERNGRRRGKKAEEKIGGKE